MKKLESSKFWRAFPVVLVMSVVKRFLFGLYTTLIRGQMRMLQNMTGLENKLIKIHDACAIPQAAALLGSGEVIALPTDTVYGLACSANNRDAIKKLYDIKGRNCTKPIAICVPEIKDVQHWGKADHLPRKLLEALLPGAVTIVVYKSSRLDNPYLNPGFKKIGIRVPKFDFIRNVTKEFSAPMALTSANRSSQKSTLNVYEFQGLWPQLGAVFDGGQIGDSDEQRAASTVIDISKPGKFTIIREGVAIKSTIELLEKFNFKRSN